MCRELAGLPRLSEKRLRIKKAEISAKGRDKVDMDVFARPVFKIEYYCGLQNRQYMNVMVFQVSLSVSHDVQLPSLHVMHCVHFIFRVES